MPPKSDHKDLDFYRKKLSRAKYPVICSRCEAPVLPKIFEDHFSLFHAFNPKIGCVWCEKISWNSSEKHANARHLIACFEKRYEPSRFPAPSPPPPPPMPKNLLLLVLLHLFPEKDHFGIVALRIHALYEFIWLQPVKVIRLFQDHNLNLAAACVHKYLELRSTHDFFHVFVKAVALKRFVEAMDEDGGKTHTLPFSCWCDGGHYEDPMYRHHRHMIVASPKGRFLKKVWGKVEISDKERPCPSYPCKGMKRIDSPMHLVNTLGYVSNRKSRCEGSCRSPDKLYHFYLYRTLPIDYKLPLVLLWEGGLEQLLYEQKYQNVSISRLIEKPVVRVRGQWKQKIKDFYGHERGLVVPVAKGLIPTRERPWEAACTFHLLDGEKLYFEYSRESETLDEETWLRKQVEGGNCFYDVVEEGLWTMRKRDQKILSLVMPLVEENEELKSENADLKEQHEADLKEQHEAVERKIQRRVDSVKRQATKKMAKMKIRHERKMAQMKRRHEEEMSGMKDSTTTKRARMESKDE